MPESRILEDTPAYRTFLGKPTPVVRAWPNVHEGRHPVTASDESGVMPEGSNLNTLVNPKTILDLKKKRKRLFP